MCTRIARIKQEEKHQTPLSANHFYEQRTALVSYLNDKYTKLRQGKWEQTNMESQNTKTDKVPTWGVSLPVENVQELVRKNPSFVPQIYIRNHDDASHDSSDVPVIDLSLLSDRNEAELEKLDRVCTDWGFFQVINHGVAEDIMRHMKESTSHFFNLPLEEKNKHAMPINDIQGYGQAYVVSKEQKLDWSDALMLFIYPRNFRKLELWPTSPPELKDAIETYSAEMAKVAERLLSSLSLIMKMDKDALLNLHKEPMQALRVNYYPTCCTPDDVLGVSPHSDTSSITILMQDDDVTGLQIRHDGGWVPVKPIPKALVVNLGDVMEIWSNGKYKSIEHRAVTNKDKERISFASFITPYQDVEIEPLNHMLDLQNPVKLYKKIKYGDYLRDSMKKNMDGKAHTEIAKNGLD